MKKRTWIVVLMVFWGMVFGGVDFLAEQTPYWGAAAMAQSSSELPDDLGPPPPNPVIQWGLFIAPFILLWFIFYKLIYPFLLKYYTPKYCRSLFWSMFGLYSMGWLAISAYVIFDIGFRVDWIKWVFVFIGAVWLIWFIVIMFKKDPGYNY